MYRNAPCYAVLAAGGSGARAGTGLPKQFRELCGKTIIARAFELFEDHPAIDGVVTVINQRYAAEWAKISRNYKKTITTVNGEKTRQGSVFAGLIALKTRVAANKPALVLIHDAARPLTAYSIINGVIDAAFDCGGAVAAVPVTETVKISAGGFAEQTPDRDKLFFAQTPQAFWLDALITAHETAAQQGFAGYDDASLIERLGGRVKLTAGSPDNIKITTNNDFKSAELILRQIISNAEGGNHGPGYEQ
ncbi:MAG: 2-C-methyl-D-erythritol 4-phosphate cytidylyltransferase [Clostridiales bacterium]|jgi:2-C-methyl-D-erythritol 4-phosphate cytidylyltransferase/2-C-methyl-D-erythritol 2,4-cyclodiphosphate synthase|nr:2-C-methyl-D-erythritol 4-phosphate cytidylyltransferase [Clostridiales bacterium]